MFKHRIVSNSNVSIADNNNNKKSFTPPRLLPRLLPASSYTYVLTPGSFYPAPASHVAPWRGLSEVPTVRQYIPYIILRWAQRKGIA